MGVEKNEKNEKRIIKKKEETKNGLGRPCTRGQKK
jgi:hypothetical protein